MYPVFGQRECVWTEREPVLPPAYSSRRNLHSLADCDVARGSGKAHRKRLRQVADARIAAAERDQHRSPCWIGQCCVRSIEIFNLGINHLQIFNYRAQRWSSPARAQRRLLQLRRSRFGIGPPSSAASEASNVRTENFRLEKERHAHLSDGAYQVEASAVEEVEAAIEEFVAYVAEHAPRHRDVHRLGSHRRPDEECASSSLRTRRRPTTRRFRGGGPRLSPSIRQVLVEGPVVFTDYTPEGSKPKPIVLRGRVAMMPRGARPRHGAER